MLKMDKKGRIYQSASHRSDGTGFERAPATVKHFGDVTFDQAGTKFEQERIRSWKNEQAFNRVADAKEEWGNKQAAVARKKQMTLAAAQNALEQNPLYQNKLRREAVEGMIMTRRGYRDMKGLGHDERQQIAAHYENAARKRGQKNFPRYEGIQKISKHEQEQIDLKRVARATSASTFAQQAEKRQIEEKVWDRWEKQRQGNGCNDVLIENVNQLPNKNSEPFAPRVKGVPLRPSEQPIPVSNSNPGLPMSVPGNGQKLVNGVLSVPDAQPYREPWLKRFFDCLKNS